MSSPTPTSLTAVAEDAPRRDSSEVVMEEDQAAHRIPDGHVSAHEKIGGTTTKGEGLVTLDEAVEDGTVVNTAGTLIFSELEVREPPDV